MYLFLFSEACAHAIGLHAKQSPQTNTPPDLVCYWILKKRKKKQTAVMAKENNNHKIK